MKNILFVLFFLSIYGIADPGDNRLISPDKVTRLKSGLVKVTYTLPCSLNDWTRIVMSSDDSGDRVAAVGVVYSAEKRNCKSSGGTHVFTEIANPKAFGYPSKEVEFKPMEVDTYSKDLTQYVSARLKMDKPGKPSVQKLITEKVGSLMSVEEGSLQCLGYPSWEEENEKAVGVCLVDAVDTGSGGDHLKVRYSVSIGDDTEHPGESRSLSVHQVSYLIF